MSHLLMRYRLTGRMYRILTGATFLLFFASTVVVGVKIADGLLRDVYQVRGSFAAAGQGLLEDSDVKIYGVNVGRVANVRLQDGRALVRMDVKSGERIPVTAKATIRPKTLFGEKFVDIEPGSDETRGRSCVTRGCSGTPWAASSWRRCSPTSIRS